MKAKDCNEVIQNSQDIPKKEVQAETVVIQAK